MASKQPINEVQNIVCRLRFHTSVKQIGLLAIYVHSIRSGRLSHSLQNTDTPLLRPAPSHSRGPEEGSVRPIPPLNTNTTHTHTPHRSAPHAHPDSPPKLHYPTVARENRPSLEKHSEMLQTSLGGAAAGRLQRN